MNKLQKIWRDLTSRKYRMDYFSDGLGVTNRELGFLTDKTFAAAWDKAVLLNREGWSRRREVPDVRWRAHVCCWAARHGLDIEGDFVECGVHTGLFSLTVCNFLNFATKKKRFLLFDTFAGIPLDGLSEEEKADAVEHNEKLYFDVYGYAKRNFAEFPNAHLIRGILPESLEAVSVERIAYLSVDLNNATSERKTIEALWPKLSPGACVVIDDYAHRGYRPQYDMWNEFASRAGKSVLTLPTGQGLLIR